MIKKFAFALATAALLASAMPAFAQDEEVSDDVDKALWCGSTFATITQIDGVSDADKATADEKATIAFTQAKLAMDADGIEESEYDRLIQYYTEIAVENLTDPDAEMRYTIEECDALAVE